jgi:site-specific recombinase XerD
MVKRDFLKEFDADLKRQGKSDLTRHGYLSDLKDYAAWVHETYGETLNPAKITREDIQAYLKYKARKAKPATTNRKLAALSAFCRWAVAAGILKADPAAGIKGAKQAKTSPKALDRAKLNRLLRKVQHSGRPLHAAIVTLLANTGIRVGELCKLTLEDVEFKPRSGNLVVRSGKGEKFRELPLNAEARRYLDEYIKVRPNPTVAGDDHLFIGQRGEAITSSGVWRILNKYAEQAEVGAISPHTLRHTFATLLLREGKVDLVTVADLLGHENINTTAQYTRSTEADRRAAVEKLAQA